MEGYWKVYFCTQHKDYSSFLTQINNDCEKAIWYYHPGGKKDADRPHIHGLIVNYKYTDDTLRKNVKKVFSLSEPTQHGISCTFSRGVKMTEFNWFKYITYCSKGQYDPVSNKLFDEKEVSELKAKYVDEEKLCKQPINIVIEPREKRAPKLTQFQVSKEAEIRYMILYPDDDEIEYRKMATIVVQTLADNKTLAHKNTVKYILQDIQSRAHPDTFITDVLQMM